MKPSWKDAPEWANYVAMDEDGEWCWFEVEPETVNGTHCGVWETDLKYKRKYIRKPKADEWKKTLQSRPD